MDRHWIIREATVNDIEQLHAIRISVKENMLSDPKRITYEDYLHFITAAGKGWVCEKGGHIVGFAIIDHQQKNIWALFVHPDVEGSGIGRALHDAMLRWHYNNSNEMLWLGTAPETRAADFYRKAGWKEQGMQPNGELRFEMSVNDWKTATNHEAHSGVTQNI